MKWLVLVVALAACGDDSSPKLTVEQLQDPATCMECHPKHYQQWSGSMHAYAAEDPVFLAMNKRGQRETGGKLGAFCINCHAPMAVQLGLVDDSNAASFDPSTLPAAAKGVTCYFCHNVKEVTTTHNNGFVLAMDQTMRGGAKNPVDNPAHHSVFDPLMDSDTNESEMCGSCHDIVVPEAINGVAGGVAVERTFREWQTTFFAKDKSPGIHLTCGGCHMQSSNDVIADAPGLSVPQRPQGFHEHMWPGIDQALTPFPEIEAQAAAIKRDLDSSVAILGPRPLGGGPQKGGICVTPENGGQISVRVDTLNIGHAFPSGAAQDRRAWLEIKAYDANNQIIFQSGVVPDGMDPEQINDPYLFGMWDQTFGSGDAIAHFFWEVKRNDDAWLLPPPITNDPTDPASDHSVTKRYPIIGLQNIVERVETRIRMRALPYDVIDKLVASGDLAPEIRDRLPTLDIKATQRVWMRATRDPATGCGGR